MSHKLPTKVFNQQALMGGIGIGLVLAGIGWSMNSSQFWQGYLLNAFYFLSITLGAMVFLSIHHISNAGWSTAIRRIPEIMMGYLPIGALAMLLVFFGSHSLYEWTHTAEVQSNPILKAKSGYLNTFFFFGRMVVLLGVWIGFAWWLRMESFKQDQDGSIEHTYRSRKIAGGFLAVFAVTSMVASFDWLMSVEPEFYSTIYSWYCFSGLFLTGMAAVTVLAILLRRRGMLTHVTDDHLHSLGKMVFGFSTFWAYIWLSQYLLIYYANLPEETVFYFRRTSTPGWMTLFLVNLFLNWLIPFLVLIPRNSKRDDRWLLVGCSIVLIGHWVDLYMLIYPAFGGSPTIGLSEIGLTLGFASLFLLIFSKGLEKVSLLPRHDPYLIESLAQSHQHATGYPENVVELSSKRFAA